MTFICVLKLYGIVNILKQTAESDQEANKVFNKNRSKYNICGQYSLLTIGLATTWDSYYFLFHLYEAMDKEVFLKTFKNLKNKDSLDFVSFFHNSSLLVFYLGLYF